MLKSNRAYAWGAALCWVIMVGVLWVTAMTAQAAPFTQELENDYQSALAWWGVPAPPQCGSVEREVLDIDDPYGEGVAGRTTQPAIGEIGILCSIHLFEPALAEQFPSACQKEMVLRHEVGHLLGFGHVFGQPRNIMSGEGILISHWCPDSVEKARWRHLLQLERCLSLPAHLSHRQRNHCWERSRRTLQDVLAAHRS
jgi:hypothetical protein